MSNLVKILTALALAALPALAQEANIKKNPATNAVIGPMKLGTGVALDGNIDITSPSTIGSDTGDTLTIGPTTLNLFGAKLIGPLNANSQPISGVSTLGVTGVATFTSAPVFSNQAGTRTALGLGTAATVNTGTSGATIPLLNAANTWGAAQTFGTISVGQLSVAEVNATDMIQAPLVDADEVLSSEVNVAKTPSATGHTDLALALGDGDTGLFEYSDDILGFATLGAARLYLDSTGLKTSSSNGGMLLTGTPSSTVPVFSFSSDTNTGIGAGGADVLSLIAGGVNKLNVNTTGVGIGTSAARLLDVGSASQAGVVARFLSGVSNASSDVLIVDADNSNSRAALQVQGNGGAVEALFAASNGAVGIGTTSPSTKLQATDTTTATSGMLTTGRFDASVANTSASTVASKALLAISAFQSTATANLNAPGYLLGAHGVARNDNATYTVADGRGIMGSVWNLAAGTMTNGYSFYAETPTVSAGGITTAYGFYLSPHKISGVTTGYGLYQSGSNDINFFAGNVILGTAGLSSYRLNVNGTLGVSGQSAFTQTPGSLAATPTIAFGDLDTGFYESADDVLNLSVAGTNRFTFNSTSLAAAGLTKGASVARSEASGTVPVFTFTSDTDTGVGSSANNTLNLITDSLSRLTVTNSGISMPAASTANFAGSQLNISSITATDIIETPSLVTDYAQVDELEVGGAGIHTEGTISTDSGINSGGQVTADDFLGNVVLGTWGLMINTEARVIDGMTGDIKLVSGAKLFWDTDPTPVIDDSGNLVLGGYNDRELKVNGETLINFEGTIQFNESSYGLRSITGYDIISPSGTINISGDSGGLNGPLGQILRDDGRATGFFWGVVTGDFDINFATERAISKSLTGNATFTASNYTAGAETKLRIVCDGTGRTLTWPASWVWVGSTAPASIAANKTMVVTLFSWGTTDADVTASYQVQP